MKINNQDLLMKKRILVNFNKEKNSLKRKGKDYLIDNCRFHRKKLLITQSTLIRQFRLLNSKEIKR